MINLDFLMGYGAGKAAGGGGGGGGSGNAQIVFGSSSITSTEATPFPDKSITVAETGTYSVYWINRRSSSGIYFNQMYIDGVPYGSQQSNVDSKSMQLVELTEVSLRKNQVVELWGACRGESYPSITYVFEIVQTS